MRTLKIFIPLFFITLIFSSCRKDRFLGIWGKGDNVTEIRDISGFTGIDLAMNANVYYVQDSIYRVEVSAQPNIISHIETEVQGAVLTIDCRPALHRHNSIAVIVHSPQMDLLRLGGSGNIYAPFNISSTSLEVSLCGSGDISLQSVTANDLTCQITGSGNMDVKGGTVSSEELIISGSGSIDVLNVVGDSGNVRISGSGDVDLHVEKQLYVSISGSGNVRYKSTPAIETHISGSGNVTHIK